MCGKSCRGDFLAATEIRRIFPAHALFQTSSYRGMSLGTAHQMCETSASSRLRIASIPERWKQVSYLHARIRRCGVGTMEINAGGEQELFDHHVEAFFFREVCPCRCIFGFKH